MSERRFPAPWSVETIPGGLKVCDANGQSLAYVYSRENPNDAHIAKVLTEDRPFRGDLFNSATPNSLRNRRNLPTKSKHSLHSLRSLRSLRSLCGSLCSRGSLCSLRSLGGLVARPAEMVRRSPCRRHRTSPD